MTLSITQQFRFKRICRELNDLLAEVREENPEAQIFAHIDTLVLSDCQYTGGPPVPEKNQVRVTINGMDCGDP